MSSLTALISQHFIEDALTNHQFEGLYHFLDPEDQADLVTWLRRVRGDQESSARIDPGISLSASSIS